MLRGCLERLSDMLGSLVFAVNMLFLPGHFPTSFFFTHGAGRLGILIDISLLGDAHGNLTDKNRHRMREVGGK